MSKSNVGFKSTNLNNSEKWLLFDVNDGRSGGERKYISATDITMVAQDPAANTITYVYYKSGVNSSTVKITHPADANKVLVDNIYAALLSLPESEKGLVAEVVYTAEVKPTAISTGCDICPTADRAATVTEGAIDPSIPISLLSVTGTKAYSLADGTVTGTRITLICTVAASTPAGTLTPTTTSGAWATAKFELVGQVIELVWTGAGWAISDRSSGATAATGAVAGLPVIA